MSNSSVSPSKLHFRNNNLLFTPIDFRWSKITGLGYIPPSMATFPVIEPISKLRINKENWSYLLKRVLDIVLGGFIFLFLSPFFLLVAILIKLNSNGPVFYKQQRVGLHGKLFRIYKFRSMIKDADRFHEKLQDLNERPGLVFKIRQDPRVTRVGKWLRKTSMDELPQLINVIRGEMSLVGPRPPLPCEVNKYNRIHRLRLETIPGMTGLWQVSGRCEIPFEKMVEMDIKYIQNWSLLQDLKILLKTPKAIFSGRGAY